MCPVHAGHLSGVWSLSRACFGDLMWLLSGYTLGVSAASMAELTRLPEEEAVQRYFDGRNWSVLRLGVALFLPGSFFGIIASMAEGRPGLAPLWGAALLINLVLFFGRSRPFMVEHARQFLVASVLIHLVAVVFSMPTAEPEPAYIFAGYMFPIGLAFYRMRWFEYLSLHLVFFGTAIWFATRPEMGSGSGAFIGLTVGVVAWLLFTGGMSIRMTRRRRKTFLVDWRREVARDREEARMRGELMDAREIQLSMLPRTTPELEWLDSSGLSIPASEVGGDYYEYFLLDADRLAVIIGDVAGHGVASGLVLSGVRSGLHLLHDEFERPGRGRRALEPNGSRDGSRKDVRHSTGGLGGPAPGDGDSGQRRPPRSALSSRRWRFGPSGRH